uniref:hypothetical protein n=1 Tax=uncultured Psychrobacter sp. TaxID=259303 RepID=UPI0025934D64|nr:hypothetical protein [uncultured Psychrobacter sp.]
MKIVNNKINSASHPSVKGWSLKVLSAVVLGSMASSVGHTSDLEIYQGATYGNASIMMMLDNSGSMDTRSIRADYPGVDFWYSDTAQLKEYIYSDDGESIVDSITYEVNFYRGDDGKNYYDRMSRLKMALMPMFANPRADNAFGKDVDLSKYKIGLGSFYYQSSYYNTKNGGKIINPVLDLTLENRKKLLATVKGLSASTNTPTADAYAEAGAYMLGTNTQSGGYETRYIEVGYSTPKNKNNLYVYECDDNKSNFSTSNGLKYYVCDDYKYIGTVNIKSGSVSNVLGSYDESVVVGDGTYYFKAVTKNWGGNGGVEGGFDQSSDDTKLKPDLTKYDSPIKGEANQCDGYGIYFLTDGEPNTSTSNTIDLMENSLMGSSLTMGNSCNSSLPSTGTYGAAARWECIGEYSTYLYNKENPKSTLIATATVGFGNVFKKLTDKGKITRTITRPSGAVETVQVYQCDASGIGPDAKNLCKLGEKGEGYGEGGFYYTEESVDIANSVRKFIEDVSKAEIDPISAGTMSVPLDSLGGLKSRQFAYLPILEPIPKSPLLWNGNLKKYKVKNATLVGADDKFVFADDTGLFANNTHDLWNTISSDNRPDNLRPDRGAPQVGGAYQKVFENANAPTIGDRNLFVDNGSGLTNLKVIDKKPINFDALTTANGYDNDKKLTLLNFMGYSEPSATNIQDGTKLTATQDKWLKNIGGVLHSIPQLITQKVDVKASGEFDSSSRKDYIIYGSMDGALHMVDDSTGQETFTFIPKHILDLQPEAITGNGTAEDGSYPYGVDAPWLTYVSYTNKSKTEGKGDAATTTNSYEADQSFALGGLRMGGSMYYALDVSDVTKPEMIYSVGSNYANKLQDKSTGETTVLAGTRNNVTSLATDEQKAFARMGQTWGKPTLGYVKSGGKKVMVSFLPGGYDTCYEDPMFKLDTNYPTNTQCNNKSTAQGSAVYMVQVGEVESKANNEDKVNTKKNNGKLLWWASNEGSANDSTSRSSSLQYSKSADLKHSVVTQIRALDRNYDGFIDHIYFADLGGQVWRVDINNNEDTDNFKIDRVVKVLDVSDQADGSDAPPRFYERPLVTFYNGRFDYKDAKNNTGSYSGIQAMITVGTGDRSSPVTAERSKPDALYTFIDKDVTRSDLFHYKKDKAPEMILRTPVIKVEGQTSRNDKLQRLTFSDTDIGRSGIKSNMQKNIVQGWYMPLTHWLGEEEKVDGKYKLKMFNEPDAIASVLITSSFNPDRGQEIKACSAGVRGSTQRERTCLPYGVCLDTSGNEVVTTRSTFNAGSGIVDNIISQFNDTSVFTSLVNRCEGDECKPELICPNGNCGNDQPPVFEECTGPDCGVGSGINTDKRINPLSWMEH